MSDTGFIEDILNEEDHDEFVESPRREDTALMKAGSIRDRQLEPGSDARGGTSYDPPRQHNAEFKGKQKQNRNKSMQGMHSRKNHSKYFIIRSGNMENVHLSYDQGGWATQVRNEHKLRDAFQNADSVYLIFSVNSSGHFQGYARMTTLPGKLGRNINWAGGHNVGNCFGVEWECWSELPYEQTLDLRNPLNENKPVKISRDGVELPADIGDELISRLHQFAKQKAAPHRPNRNVGQGKPAGGRQGFNSNNIWGHRGGGGFDGFPDRPMGPRGMMDPYDMPIEGPLGHMGPIGPGVGLMGMAPGMGPMGMRPMMPGVMPNDGPMMDMMGGGMGMGMMMDGPMRPGMMMDPMNMRRGMGMGMHGPRGNGPPRNQSPAPFSHNESMMGNGNMHGPGMNGGFPGQSRLGGSSSNLHTGMHQQRSPSPQRERGRSPTRRSGSRGRVHSRSRSRSHDRGRAPNLMEVSYDEYLEHYKKVQRRMREMQEMKVTSQQQAQQPPQQGNMGGGSNGMGTNMFGGMMGMGGMNPMMSGMNQMMGGGMGPNMGMMYNNMGGMMSRSSGIMSEPEYVKLCQRYFASHGRPCPPDDKLRKYYRDMKAQWEMHTKQRS